MLDGFIDEPVWQGISIIDGMKRMDPDTLEDAPYRTDIRFFYTERGLYFGIVNHQPAETVISRLAPRDSKIRIIHLGKAHNQKWLNSMRAEEDANPRFISLGDVPAWRVRRQFSTSRAMVISSIMEGGANVVSEAVVAGLPIIASEIDGNIGLLGPDYKGYYPAKDTKALASLLNKLEEEPGFLRHLAGQIKKRQNYLIHIK